MEKNKLIKAEIIVNEIKIRIKFINGVDYISLTDIAKLKNFSNPSDVIKKWLSNDDTIEYIGLWETLSNKNFNSAEFRQIKTVASTKSFTMTPNQWCLRVNAIGLICGKGRYSIGTFAHPDIALEFASWIDNLFKLYLIKEFERLKKQESYYENRDWQANRLLSKLNYAIHTDAIKTCIVPTLTEEQKRYVYANEADVLNVALFGITAKEWKSLNSSKKGNIRDDADLLHLVILNNLENTNAELIEANIPQSERLIRLNNAARRQMEVLKENKNIEKLDQLQKEVNEEAMLIEKK